MGGFSRGRAGPGNHVGLGRRANHDPAAGVVFDGGNEDNFMAFDARTRRNLWHYQTGSPVSGAASLDSTTRGGFALWECSSCYWSRSSCNGRPHPTPAQQSAAPSTLDYEFFKTKVQPIFLNKRPGHARCIVCHETGSPRLQPLPEGATTWSEEDSQKNFDAWKRVVVPGRSEGQPVVDAPAGCRRRRRSVPRRRQALDLAERSRVADTPGVGQRHERRRGVRRR